MNLCTFFNTNIRLSAFFNPKAAEKGGGGGGGGVGAGQLDPFFVVFQKKYLV